MKNWSQEKNKNKNDNNNHDDDNDDDHNSNNNNNLMGACPLAPAWCHLTEGRSISDPRNSLSSRQLWVFPIPATRPTSSGHITCMAHPPTADTTTSL